MLYATVYNCFGTSVSNDIMNNCIVFRILLEVAYTLRSRGPRPLATKRHLERLGGNRCRSWGCWFRLTVNYTTTTNLMSSLISLRRETNDI